MTAVTGTPDTISNDGPWKVFLVFLRLGLTSFGGPIAHLGFFHTEFVARRRWLSEEHYADIVALSQFLPGPASSKVGIMVGVLRAGIPGALAAWLGFTLPSALALIAFGYGVAAIGDLAGASWLHGLKIVAVAVVAQAVWGMAKNLCPDRERLAIAAAATVLALMVPTTLGQVGAIVVGGLIGWFFLPGEAIALTPLPVRISRLWSIGSIVLFFALLIGLPLVVSSTGSHALAMFDAFYRSGSLVFGGGHVVLPLLEAAVSGLIPHDQFLAGYGAAQAVPGPVFTFAAYLGVLMQTPPNGVTGALIALVAIFLPSIFLVIGVLPFWWQLRVTPAARRVLAGVNAAVVGLLGAVLWNPVIPLGIPNLRALVVALAVYAAVEFWKIPPWAAVIAAAVAGFAAL
jgi:chromate transporter